MAITVTVTATKIDVVSTGGVEETFDAIVAAVNTHTPGTILGTGTDINPYIITCTTYRELVISDNCYVRFVSGTYLQWQNASTSTYIFEFSQAAHVVIEAGCHFNLSTGASKLGLMLWHGEVTIEGTLGNEVVFENYRTLYVYPFLNHDIDYVIFKNVGYSSGYMFYLPHPYYSRITSEVSYTNLTFLNDNGNRWGRIFFGETTGGVSKAIIENITIDSVDIIYMTTATIKVKNVTVNNINSYISTLAAGKGSYIPYLGTDGEMESNFNYRNQPKLTLENWSMVDVDNGAHNIYTQYGSVIKIKDCHFENNARGVRSLYDTRIIWVGTNTFTNITTPKYFGTGCMNLSGKELPITITDSGGSPIEGAVVKIEQSEGKETWFLVTNSAGQVKDVFGDDCVFIESQETSLGVFDPWSDNEGAGRYHTISVMAPGKAIHSENFLLGETESFSIQLEDAGTGGTDNRIIIDQEVLS